MFNSFCVRIVVRIAYSCDVYYEQFFFLNVIRKIVVGAVPKIRGILVLRNRRFFAEFHGFPKMY